MLLTLGFALLALALSVVVIDTSVVFLARRSLAAACDSAALAGAQAIDADAVYRKGAGGSLPLGRSGSSGVSAAVRAYQRRSYPARDFPGLTMSATTTGSTVTVTATRPVALPFTRYLRSIGIGSVVVRASSTARADRSA